jgi:CheY-like chemotaxis protein
VLTAENGVVGLKLLAENSVDLIVLDYHMPEMDGLAVATAIRKCHEHLPIVLLTGYAKEPPKQLLDMVDAFMTKGRVLICCWASYVGSLVERRNLRRGTLLRKQRFSWKANCHLISRRRGA